MAKRITINDSELPMKNLDSGQKKAYSRLLVSVLAGYENRCRRCV